MKSNVYTRPLVTCGARASRSARRAARCPSRRARRRAPPWRYACAAGSGTCRAPFRASASSCGVAVLLVLEVVVGRTALAEILALVRGKPVVQRLQADPEHVGRLALGAAFGERRLDQPAADIVEGSADPYRKEGRGFL